MRVLRILLSEVSENTDAAHFFSEVLLLQIRAGVKDFPDLCSCKNTENNLDGALPLSLALFLFLHSFPL
jgi:hypothetical protein